MLNHCHQKTSFSASDLNVDYIKVYIPGVSGYIWDSSIETNNTATFETLQCCLPPVRLFWSWLFQKLGIDFRALSFKESTRTSVLNCFEDAKPEILKILLTNRICFFQRPRAVQINSSSFYIFVKGNNYS